VNSWVFAPLINYLPYMLDFLIFMIYQPGLIPTNKKTQKNSLNSGKIFRLLKIPQIFQIVFLSIILRKKSAEILPANSTKKLVRKFF
jgi:hypothetical protein